MSYQRRFNLSAQDQIARTSEGAIQHSKRPQNKNQENINGFQVFRISVQNSNIPCHITRESATSLRNSKDSLTTRCDRTWIIEVFRLLIYSKVAVIRTPRNASGAGFLLVRGPSGVGFLLKYAETGK